METLSKMLEYGFKPDTEVQYCLDEELLIVKVPDYGRVFEVDVNDRVVPGISIANSEVGVLAFAIQAYYYRLICSNGIIAMTSVAKRFKHVSRRALDDFSLLIADAIRESKMTQEHLLISIKSKVDHPISTIRTLGKQLNLNKKELQAVEEAWELDPGYTMWRIINAFTSAAREPRLSAEQSYKLEKAGGMILSMVKH